MTQPHHSDDWPPFSHIETDSSGTFQLSESGVYAKLYPVTFQDELLDVVAWPFGNPDTWWLAAGNIWFLGHHELMRVGWSKKPTRLVATPADFLAQAGHCLCVLDWSQDVRELLEQVPELYCETPALKAAVEHNIKQHSRPRVRLRA